MDGRSNNREAGAVSPKVSPRDIKYKKGRPKGGLFKLFAFPSAGGNRPLGHDLDEVGAVLGGCVEIR